MKFRGEHNNFHRQILFTAPFLNQSKFYVQRTFLSLIGKGLDFATNITKRISFTSY